MFVPSKTFQPSQVFVSKARASLSEASFSFIVQVPGLFVPGKPFQPSLMAAISAVTYQIGALQGRLLALATNIRLDQECQPRKHSSLLRAS